MASCPVCDTPRAQGDACEVCGLPFPAADRREVPVPPVEGLEPTLHEAAPPPQEAMSELEPTAAARVPELAAPPVEGLELTSVGPGSGAAPPLLDPPPEPVAGLEPTAADPVPGDGPAPGPVVCRYCRTPAAGPEPLCGRCGMRLPVARPSRPQPAAERRPCSDCGSPTSGARCPACGARQNGG